MLQVGKRGKGKWRETYKYCQRKEDYGVPAFFQLWSNQVVKISQLEVELDLKHFVDVVVVVLQITQLVVGSSKPLPIELVENAQLIQKEIRSHLKSTLFVIFLADIMHGLLIIKIHTFASKHKEQNKISTCKHDFTFPVLQCAICPIYLLNGKLQFYNKSTLLSSSPCSTYTYVYYNLTTVQL